MKCQRALIILTHTHTNNQVDLISTRQVSTKQHENFILDHDEVQGGVFMSAKTGENVVKAFYKVHVGAPVAHLVMFWNCNRYCDCNRNNRNSIYTSWPKLGATVYRPL
jgi:hypothetical protein